MLGVRTVGLLSILSVGLSSAVALDQPLPSFQVKDLNGVKRSPRELIGKPSVLIVMLNPRASAGVRQWFDEVVALRLEDRIGLVGVLAVDVAFFVPWKFVAGSVRGEVPRRYWGHAWVDAHGTVADRLGLDASGAEPYVITTDADGRVTSIYHGLPSPEALSRVERALDLPDGARDAPIK